MVDCTFIQVQLLRDILGAKTVFAADQAVNLSFLYGAFLRHFNGILSIYKAETILPIKYFSIYFILPYRSKNHKSLMCVDSEKIGWIDNLDKNMIFCPNI